MFDDRRLKLLFEQREQFAAQAGAEARGVPVGGVFAPRLLSRPEVVAQLGAADVQQRPDNMFGLRMNAAETGEAGAAQDMRQNGFRLVIGSMGDGQAIDFLIRDQAGKESVARAAGGIFEIGFFAFGFGGNIDALKVKLEMAGGRQFGDEVFVGVGSAAPQTMVHMRDAEDDAKPFLQLEQKPQ